MPQLSFDVPKNDAQSNTQYNHCIHWDLSASGFEHQSIYSQESERFTLILTEE